MVPSPSTRPREQAAGYPQRETSRPLPVLRTSDELPKSPEVPTERPTYLEEVAGTKVAGKGPDLDKVRANPSTPPAPTSQDRTTSDQNGESYLRNPLGNVASAFMWRPTPLTLFDATNRALNAT